MLKVPVVQGLDGLLDPIYSTASVMPLSDAKEKIVALLKRVKIEEAIENFVEPIATDPLRVEVYLDLQQSLGGLLEEQPV